MMRPSVTALSIMLAAALLSCSKQSLQNTYDAQEKKILNERLVKISGAQTLTGPYWTSCYYDASTAYYQDIANNYHEKGKKNSEKKGRPVLYL